MSLMFGGPCVAFSGALGVEQPRPKLVPIWDIVLICYTPILLQNLCILEKNIVAAGGGILLQRNALNVISYKCGLGTQGAHGEISNYSIGLRLYELPYKKSSHPKPTAFLGGSVIFHEVLVQVIHLQMSAR